MSKSKMTKKQEPIGIIEDDRWSQEALVVFADENIGDWIPDEWVEDSIRESGEEISFEEQREQLKSEFLLGLTEVDSYRDMGSFSILKQYNSKNYTKYWESGECTWLGEYSSFEECIEDLDND